MEVIAEASADFSVLCVLVVRSSRRFEDQNASFSYPTEGTSGLRDPYAKRLWLDVAPEKSPEPQCPGCICWDEGSRMGLYSNS